MAGFFSELLRVVVIDQFSQVTGFRAAEIFFEPLQLHMQAAYLLEELCLFGVAFFLVLGLAAPCEQLTSTIQKLPLPLTDLDGLDGVISGDLLDRLAATDRLHGDSGLELGAVGEALAHRWEPSSGAVPRNRG
jgi:hypothetical protein